jgi:hypothetical protein
MELIRNLLSYVEEHGSDPTGWIDHLLLAGATEEAVNYHVWLLADAGYVAAIDLSDSEGMCYRPRCLTSAGHDFLATVRSQDVWVRIPTKATTRSDAWRPPIPIDGDRCGAGA